MAASQAPAGQPPGILIAGNSYSYYNCGVDEVLRGLMRETRRRLRSEVTLEAVSGGAVAAHPLPQLLRSRGGLPGPGIVILQVNSAAAAAGHSGFYRRGVLAQAEAARRSGAVPMLVMTWSVRGEAGAAEAAREALRAGREARLKVIPVGLAFELAEKTGRAKLRMPDGRHPSAAGTYLYGAVLYSSLFGRSPEGLAYRGGCEKPLEPALARFLQGCAWKAVTDFSAGQDGQKER